MVIAGGIISRDGKVSCKAIHADFKKQSADLIQKFEGMIAKFPTHNHRKSFTSSSYVEDLLSWFNTSVYTITNSFFISYQVENGVCYICITTTDEKQRLIWAFLQEVISGYSSSMSASSQKNLITSKMVSYNQFPKLNPF